MKTIVFDLNGVIFKDKSVSVLNKLELNKDEYKELSKFFDNFKLLDLGLMTLEEKLEKSNIKDYLKNKYKDFLLHYYIEKEVDIDLINLINELKSRGYYVYILSDNNHEAINYYKTQECFKNIDGFVASCDYNTLKRDGKLFEIFLDKYNLNPKDCYFIDDLDYNIEIAKKYGFKTFKYNKASTVGDLINDMKKYDILNDDKTKVLEK